MPTESIHLEPGFGAPEKPVPGDPIIHNGVKVGVIIDPEIEISQEIRDMWPKDDYPADLPKDPDPFNYSDPFIQDTEWNKGEVLLPKAPSSLLSMKDMGLTFYSHPAQKWQFTFGKDSDCSFRVVKAPNKFQRWMQEKFLGIYWSPIPSTAVSG